MSQPQTKIRFGVVGTGRMGENHLRKYVTRTDIDFVGFFDHNATRSKEISEKYLVKSFSNLEQFLFEVDAISVVTATPHLFPIAKKALENGVHVLVEKPMTESVQEAQELGDIAKRNGLQLHVGFLERFRLRAMLAGIPTFIPTQIQLYRFNTSIGREPDRDVVSDLMVHDIDLANFLAKGKLISHVVAGATVMTANWDEALATLVFDSGTVAHISTSRVASNLARGMRLVGHGTSIELDFVFNTVRGIYREASGATKRIDLSLNQLDPLNEEISAFIACVKGEPQEHVSADAARETVRTSQLLLRSLQDSRPSAKPTVPEPSVIL